MDKNKIKSIFSGKKKTENLVVLLVLIIAVVVAINYIWNGDGKTKREEYNTDFSESNLIKQVTANYENDNIETKLEDILSNISGVGKVKVMITYSESSITQPVYDENFKESNTIETDDSGGTRSISQIDNQKQIVYKQNSDGSKEPITRSVLSPKMEGAVITAEGADKVEVKSNIIQAVEAATGLATHKIQVFEMEVK